MTQTVRFRAVMTSGQILVNANDAETALALAETQGTVRGLYLANPTPKVGGQYGAPMGRPSRALDPDGRLTASRVRLDAGGYDAGGAYWGLRPRGAYLYAVQDGTGRVAFVDAATSAAAKEAAFA